MLPQIAVNVTNSENSAPLDPTVAMRLLKTFLVHFLADMWVHHLEKRLEWLSVDFNSITEIVVLTQYVPVYSARLDM